MWGAQALLDYLPKITQQPIKLNINLDMLSRDTEQQLFAVGSYHYPAIKPLIQQVQQQTPVRLIAGHDKPWWLAGNIPDWTYASDHGHFHRRDIPFIYFGVPDHPDYHQPTDTADRVSTDFYQQVSETVLRFVLAVDASDRRF
jgi:Zn-dependent M28 family amino/carboxypeptidase